MAHKKWEHDFSEKTFIERGRVSVGLARLSWKEIACNTFYSVVCVGVGVVKHGY